MPCSTSLRYLACVFVKRSLLACGTTCTRSSEGGSHESVLCNAWLASKLKFAVCPSLKVPQVVGLCGMQQVRYVVCAVVCLHALFVAPQVRQVICCIRLSVMTGSMQRPCMGAVWLIAQGWRQHRTWIALGLHYCGIINDAHAWEANLVLCCMDQICIMISNQLHAILCWWPAAYSTAAAYMVHKHDIHDCPSSTPPLTPSAADTLVCLSRA